MTISDLYNAKEDTTALDILKRFYNLGNKVRHEYEGRWAMCERFYKGTNIDDNYIRSITNDFLPNLDKTGYVHSENAIKPLVKQAMAIICDSMSRVNCVPATDEQEDIEASYIANDFLKSREEIDDEDIIRRNELASLLVYGECARFVRYNPNKLSDDGNVGDIETFTLDPSQYVRSVTDNNSTKPEWIIMSEVYPVDKLKMLYPNRDIQKESVLTTRYGNERLERHEQDQEKCIVKRMYIRENTTHENGGYYVWTGNTLLQKGDLPDGIFPFVVFKWLYQPGYAYPEGFVEPLIKPQIVINDCLLKLAKLSDKKANPPILMAGNSEVRQETIRESGVDIYRYQMGMDRPEFLQFPHDMSETYNLLSMAREEMMSVAGLRETSLGRQPREATATQMALLKRSDNAGIGYFKYAFEKSYAKICHLKLKLAQKYFKNDRIIKIVGLNDKPLVVKFNNADLKGVIDVICKPTPYIDDAMRQNIMSQLVQQGAFYWNTTEEKYSKMLMIMNSGLPNAREIVDNILGEESFDDLQTICNSINNDKQTLEILQLTNAIMQQELQAQQMQLQYAQGQMAIGQMTGQGQEQEPMPIGAETGLEDNQQDEYISPKVANNINYSEGY